MKLIHILSACAAVCSAVASGASAGVSSGTDIPAVQTVSTMAGALPGGVRDGFSMNVGWRYHKGDMAGADARDFDDSGWEVVNVPHGLELLPEEASGGKNYRGPAWYRKHVDVPADLQGKRMTLYFEGVMGKSSVWVNGKKVADHFGGYQPIVLNVTDFLEYGKPNVIAVRADNSDDPTYAPGKPQDVLDFCYFGGIYRDVYLIGSDKVHITDANEENIVAGGGLFFWTQKIDLAKGVAECGVKVHVRNESGKDFSGEVKVSLPDAKGVSKVLPLVLKPGEDKQLEVMLDVPVTKESLWSPDQPSLTKLDVGVFRKAGGKGEEVDAMQLDVGIRTVKISKDGLFVNGEKFPEKLIGGNRHQDFAVLGNAVPNNLQWMDALKLRKAGMRVVRCAHYPMDPAFMDACDRLGLFVIVATPGWQFWGKGPFEGRVYENIRNMVRRDRNHPSVLMWEPILNETNFPADFAKRAHDATHEEYPVPGCYTGCDSISRGHEHYEVLYSHPEISEEKFAISSKTQSPDRAYFTREFGDNVDSWSSHNSSSRVSRAWGEVPMLVQAKHYLNPDYAYTCWDTLFRAPDYHFGGALWHPFDHQRGYHPDTFYGGIMDAFRQPKLSYYAFMSQRPVEQGPMVYVAHSMSPFSPKDVTVFSNCDEVRLTVQDKPPVTLPTKNTKRGLPHPPAVFPNVWDFQKSKQLTRNRQEGKDRIVAEGLVNGQVVCRHEVAPSRRPDHLKLELDTKTELVADGSSVAVVVASMVDANGSVKRLNNEEVVFDVQGPASIVGGVEQQLNPKRIQWGTAPVLVRMGTEPGKVTVNASLKHRGTQTPKSGSVTFEVKPDAGKRLFKEAYVPGKESERAAGEADSARVKELEKKLEAATHELNKLRNKEVERDQADFEGAAKNK